MSHGQWTLVRAIDIAKIEQNNFAALIAQRKGLPVMIGQLDLRRCPRRRDDRTFQGGLSSKGKNGCQSSQENENADPNKYDFALHNASRIRFGDNYIPCLFYAIYG